jgi:signal transduction histidine kinase
MGKRSFRIDEALFKIGQMTGHDPAREAFVQQILIEMVQAGFERVRFWEVAHDSFSKMDMIVLTACEPQVISSVVPGYQAKWTDSDVARQGTELEPVVAVAPDCDDDLSKLEQDVGLKGRVRVDIPVSAGSRIESILACDWRGSVDDVSPADVKRLRLIGAQVGSYLAMNPRSVSSLYRGERREDGKMPPDALACEVAAELSAVLDAAITSVFAFSWAHQEITKIDEFVARGYRDAAKKLGVLAERYPAGGPPLTGAAWRDNGPRHIIAYRSVQEHAPQLVPAPIVRWLSEVLQSEIKTILYATAGTVDKRYLIRLINRASQPELPFLRESTILDAMMSDFQSDVDAAIANQRLKSLERISERTAETGDPDAVIENIGRSLRDERIADFVAICHQEDSSRFSFARFFGPNCGHLDFSLDERWKQDSLYHAAVDAGLTVLALSEHGAGQSRLGPLLASRGFRAVLTVPLQAGHTNGVFFIPMRSSTARTKAGKRARPQDLGYGTTALIHACAHLLANAVELQHSQERVRGALRALGLMGHEVRRPIAKLGSAGRGAIVVAKKTLDEFPGDPRHEEFRWRLVEEHAGLQAAQRRVGSALRLARLIARESEDTLRLNFAERDLARVLRDALEDTDYEIRSEPRPQPWGHEFVLRESAQRLGKLVFDEDYIEEVIKNILLNAVKYSLPRPDPELTPGDRPVVLVEIIGERQTSWVAVKIRNWGWPIPEDKQDAIFQPWVRGYEEGDVEALSGMGLGLFLARRLSAAHDGEVFCTSIPTDDYYVPAASRKAQRGRYTPTRRRVRIHETLFEIRIPRGLSPGVHSHTWGHTSSWEAETSERK